VQGLQQGREPSRARDDQEPLDGLGERAVSVRAVLLEERRRDAPEQGGAVSGRFHITFELHFNAPVQLAVVQQQIIKMLSSKKFRLVGTYVNLQVNVIE
jgi:hypothetical protein